MKMLIYSANSLRDIKAEADRKKIQKENIVQILNNGDGTYTMIYFGKDDE